MSNQAFVYISLPLSHNCNVKLPNFTFHWGGEQENDFLFLFLYLQIQFFRIQLQNWIDIEWNGIRAMEFWNSANSLFTWCFRYHHHRCCLRPPSSSAEGCNQDCLRSDSPIIEQLYLALGLFSFVKTQGGCTRPYCIVWKMWLSGHWRSLNIHPRGTTSGRLKAVGRSKEVCHKSA